MNTVQQRFSAEDRREQILGVAKALFAKKGYEGTTTREIANAASVNEAIIFRHFPTKEELYWAVIDQTCRATDARGMMKDRLDRGGPADQVFRDLAEDILNRRENDQTLTRLLYFSALENHELSHRFFDNYVAQFYEVLSDFIRQRIKTGEFREVDTMLAARCFLGMVIYHSQVEILFGAGRPKKFDNKTVARELCEIWLRGMTAAPKNSDPS